MPFSSTRSQNPAASPAPMRSRRERSRASTSTSGPWWARTGCRRRSAGPRARSRRRARRAGDVPRARPARRGRRGSAPPPARVRAPHRPGTLDERATEDRHDANVAGRRGTAGTPPGTRPSARRRGSSLRARPRRAPHAPARRRWGPRCGAAPNGVAVRFAGQPEAIGLAVVRGAQHDEDAVARIGGKRAVRGGVTGDASLGTDVRGGDGPGRRAECRNR